MSVARTLEQVIPFSNSGANSIIEFISQLYDGYNVWINQDKLDSNSIVALINNEFEKISPLDYLEYNISVLDSDEINSGIIRIYLIDNGLKVVIDLSSVEEIDNLEKLRAIDLDDIEEVVLDNSDDNINNRFSGLDYDDSKITNTKINKREKPMDLMGILDMDSYNRKLETQMQLRFLQDQQNDLDLKSFASNVSNELIKISSKVKNMPHEEAYDKVIDARKRWEATDPYKVDVEAEHLADKWYGKTVTLFDSFESLDKLNNITKMLEQVSDLDKRIYDTKKRSEKENLEKQKQQLEDEINSTLGDTLNHMTRQSDIDKQIELLDNIKDSFEEYLSDFEKLSTDWDEAISKMKAEKNTIDLVDQLSSKYLKGHYNILMPMYQKLISINPPKLFDQYIESPQVMRTACLNMQLAFRKALFNFNRIYNRILDDLEEKLGKLAFSRSLF